MEKAAFGKVYDVLYNSEYFQSICGVLVLASAVGAALNVIPFFFYDLTEIKQRAMVTVLKTRALFEDYGNNALSDEALTEAIDVIEEAQEYVNHTPEKLLKSEIKRAKRSKDKQAVAEAKAMPASTKEEKSERSLLIAEAKAEAASKALIKKLYSEGLKEFDSAVFEALFEREDALNADLKKLYIRFNEATDKENKAKLKAEIKRIKLSIKDVKRQIKTASDEKSLYSRAAKPYLDAQKLLIQQKNYQRYEEIKARYLEISAQ